jgi:hypothetical protein
MVLSCDKNYIAWLRKTIKIRKKNPSNYSSDYSRGELRGYEEALTKLLSLQQVRYFV